MSPELSPEDSFRLQVLLAQELRAVRIDESESRPMLHALTDQGEASVPLHPNCKLDKYLRLVRELLSGHALGSPGGYPVHLSRWTRHGQMESANLGRLLLTGEPEAVVAVVHSPGLTDALARHAWWAQPSIDNARLMLSRERVAKGAMGAVLADFLVEHLPFLQDEHQDLMDTIAVLLYCGALTQANREAIWRRGQKSNSHYVAFLEAAGWDDAIPLPCERPARVDLQRLAAEAGDHPAGLALARAASAQGQTFLAAVEEILTRPETQEVVSRCLNAIHLYIGKGLDRAAPQAASGDPLLNAAWLLARTDAEAVNDIFARSTAIGSLMRRKIEPILGPILESLRLLRG